MVSVFLVFFLAALWTFPGAFLLAMVVVPAVSGYAFRALMRKTVRADISSVGTAVGWMLFIGLLISNPGGLGFMLFVSANLFGPPGIAFLALVALGFILVSQGVASRAVRQVLASDPVKT
ncbi:MAG: hypothetical protein V3W28_00640 [Thermoplasmata archaeon]